MASPAQLVSGAACFQSCVSAGMVESIMIVLLQQWTGTSYTAQQLVANAKCYESCLPNGIASAGEIVLLNQING